LQGLARRHSSPREIGVRANPMAMAKPSANLPLDTNMLFMTVMANGMPFVGRG
jgi:hypothetical protein